MSKRDKDLGLYGKYHIMRNDPAGKHQNCFYYVLDVTHDKFSIPALKAYIEACKEEYPLLAADLRGIVKQAEIVSAGAKESRPSAGSGSSDE